MTAPAALKRTPRRLRLGAAIQAGKVKHYRWKKPITRWEDVQGGIWSEVTHEIEIWVDAGLSTIPASRYPDFPVVTVELTDAGRAWLAKAEGVT